MDEKLKFTVSYGRTVQTRPYETMKIHLTIEHYAKDTPRDHAFSECRNKVEEWIELERKYNS